MKTGILAHMPMRIRTITNLYFDARSKLFCKYLSVILWYE